MFIKIMVSGIIMLLCCILGIYFGRRYVGTKQNSNVVVVRINKE